MSRELRQASVENVQAPPDLQFGNVFYNCAREHQVHSLLAAASRKARRQQEIQVSGILRPQQSRVFSGDFVVAVPSVLPGRHP